MADAHTPLTAPLMASVLRDLAAAFPAAKRDVAQLAPVYHRALADLPHGALAFAADECVKAERYFPPAATLRKHAAAWVKAHALPRQPVEPITVCPGCRSEYVYRGFEAWDGVVHPRKICRCPQGNPRWETPKALAWREPDAAPSRTGEAA